MTPAEIMDLEYVGGGYFRVKAPKGKSSPIIHGPEFLRLVQSLLSEKQNGAKSR